MPKDIREILKNAGNSSLELSQGHREKFENKLGVVSQSKKKNYWFLKIAASFMLLVSAVYFYQGQGTQATEEDPALVNLGSISPEMQQIENYYLTAISYEMASIEASNENKAVLDKYLERIAVLTQQYNDLTLDLSENGINEKVINALIDNLQLRLQILLELKDTINEMQTPKTIDNENNTI